MQKQQEKRTQKLVESAKKFEAPDIAQEVEHEKKREKPKVQEGIEFIQILDDINELKKKFMQSGTVKKVKLF